MRRMLDWIRSWFIGSRINRTMMALDRRLCELERLRASVKLELQKRSEALETLGSRLEAEQIAAQAGIERADALVAKYESELDAVRSERDIAVERTIPALVQSHELLLKRYDAETAIQIRREVASSIVPRNERLDV